jgi:hypothetical protein
MRMALICPCPFVPAPVTEVRETLCNYTMVTSSMMLGNNLEYIHPVIVCASAGKCNDWNMNSGT